MSSPNEPSPWESKPKSAPPSWIPAWMGERERMGLIIAAGLVLAAFVMICGGCCSGFVQTQIFPMFD